MPSCSGSIRGPSPRAPACSSSTAPRRCRRSSPPSSRKRDLDTLAHPPADTLSANDIGRARLRLAADLPLEPYGENRHAGSFLVIHPADGQTLAAAITHD